MRLWLKLIVKPSDGLPNTELFIDRNKGFIYKTEKLIEEVEQRREINK